MGLKLRLSQSEPDSDFNMKGHSLPGLREPIAPTEPATKRYVDSALISQQLRGTAGVGGVRAYQVVHLSADGYLLPASSSELGHIGRVVGIAAEDTDAGEDGYFQPSGEISNENWSLEPGAIYYLVIGGEISKIPPESGIWQRVGVAKDMITLIIEIGEPILIS